jgi:exosortase
MTKVAELQHVDPGLGEVQPTRARWLMLATLAVGALLFSIPTFQFVSRESWSTEQGAHGPIVLMTGLWLLYRLWPKAMAVAKPPALIRSVGLLALLLPAFCVARIAQIVELEGYLMYACLIAALYSLIGGKALRQLWFPLFYLGFVFPPPESLIWAVTMPMKMGVSKMAVSLLHALGYPIGGEGVVIFVGQYQLLVAAACSGLNSIISLSAITLFYIYLRHEANWRYALILAMLIVPVALLANFVRVLILILLTYHAGEAAAQGFLHNFAGLMMFMVALLTMFAIDSRLKPFLPGLEQKV